MLGGILRAAYFMKCHEQTQSMRVCWFHFFFVYSLLSKDLTIQNLFIPRMMLVSINVCKTVKADGWLVGCLE